MDLIGETGSEACLAGRIRGWCAVRVRPNRLASGRGAWPAARPCMPVPAHVRDAGAALQGTPPAPRPRRRATRVPPDPTMRPQSHLAPALQGSWRGPVFLMTRRGPVWRVGWKLLDVKIRSGGLPKLMVLSRVVAAEVYRDLTSSARRREYPVGGHVGDRHVDSLALVVESVESGVVFHAKAIGADHLLRGLSRRGSRPVIPDDSRVVGVVRRGGSTIRDRPSRMHQPRALQRPQRGCDLHVPASVLDGLDECLRVVAEVGGWARLGSVIRQSVERIAGRPSSAISDGWPMRTAEPLRGRSNVHLRTIVCAEVRVSGCGIRKRCLSAGCLLRTDGRRPG